MSRALKPSPGPEAVSNVVSLRPGIVVPTLPEEPRKRRKSLKTVTPRAPNLRSKTTTRRGKKPSTDSVLTMTPGSPQISETTVVSSSILNGRQHKNAAFKKRVGSLGKMALREHFSLEAASHSDMMSRRRSKGAVVHPDLQEFKGFLLALGPRPKPDWTLDRKNPDDPEYAPGKVRWADKRQQANNRRTTILLDIQGEIRPLTDWARMTGQEPKTLRKRLERGYSHEEAVYGRNGSAPQPVAEASAAGESGYVWPGSQQALWEDGFQAFTAYAKHDAFLKRYSSSTLTRDLFVAWIGSEILGVVQRRLRAKYPGYDDPESIEPPAVRTDQEYPVVEAYADPVWRAWSTTLNDPAQDNLLRNHLRRYRVYSPCQDWATLFKPPEED